MTTVSINEVMALFQKLSETDQFLFRRKLLKAAIKQQVKENADKYPDTDFTMEDINKEVKAVRRKPKSE